MTARELATAKSKLEALENPVVIKVVRTRNSLSDQFREFVDALASMSDKLKPVFLTYAEDGPPVIELRPNLRYLAVPGGRELSPFLESLILTSQGESPLTARSLAFNKAFFCCSAILGHTTTLP